MATHSSSNNNLEWLYITDIEELKHYTLVWDKCLKYSQDSIFSSPEWITHWKDTFWGKSWSLHLYIVFKENKCILFAPFYIKKQIQFPYLKDLHFLGQGENEIYEVSSEYQDILLHPEHTYLLTGLANRLTKLNFDQANINAVLDNAHLLTLFSTFINTTINEIGQRYAYSPDLRSPFSLSKNTKSKLNKCKNKLAALNAQFLWVDNKEHDKYWELMKNFHQIRWNKLHKDGAFNHQKFSDFHKKFRENNYNNIKISTVIVNNSPIAINYYIYSDDILYFYQSGWDEGNYSKTSPGFALHIWSMENNNYKFYDYMMGSSKNSYKSKLGCNHTKKMYKITVVRNKLKVLFVRFIHKLVYK